MLQENNPDAACMSVHTYFDMYERESTARHGTARQSSTLPASLLCRALIGTYLVAILCRGQSPTLPASLLCRALIGTYLVAILCRGDCATQRSAALCCAVLCCAVLCNNNAVLNARRHADSRQLCLFACIVAI